MGGGNVCKANSARARNAAKLAADANAGGGKGGIEKRGGDTSTKIADAQAERDKQKADRAAREAAKAAKAEKEAKRLAKLNK